MRDDEHGRTRSLNPPPGGDTGFRWGPFRVHFMRLSEDVCSGMNYKY